MDAENPGKVCAEGQFRKTMTAAATATKKKKLNRNNDVIFFD